MGFDGHNSDSHECITTCMIKVGEGKSGSTREGLASQIGHQRWRFNLAGIKKQRDLGAIIEPCLALRCLGQQVCQMGYPSRKSYDQVPI